MKILFLSHCPHEAHIGFARSVGAKIKITPFNGLVKISKKIHIVNYFYPFICLVYGFFIGVKENIILVDGGSSLWIAVAIKLKKPNIKIVYLDGDLYIINLTRNNILVKWAKSIALKKIGAVVSVSAMCQRFAKKFLDVPVKITPPYPKKVVADESVERKNYGLFVGRLDPDKNIIRVIEFCIQCPYLEKIIIVGSGALNKKVRKLAQKNKKILFVGKKDDPSEYYNKCKFLLCLPDFDPHSCAVMEATVCGCYPMMSSGTGSKYLFDNIFIINNPTDFSSINKKIKYILENEQLAKTLLQKSAKNILTKEKAIENFKNEFYNLAR